MGTQGEKIELRLVTPSGLILEKEVDAFYGVGLEGEFGVLPNHANYLVKLTTSTSWLELNGQKEFFFISGGYAKVEANHVLVMAEAAERAEDINLERAKRALARAEEREKQSGQDPSIDVARCEAALKRAITRMNTASKKLV